MSKDSSIDRPKTTDNDQLISHDWGNEQDTRSNTLVFSELQLISP